MAYDQQLLERIRAVLAGRRDVAEKKMFGGVAFMVRGNMACGPHGKNLIVRIGPDAAAAAMKEPHVKPMVFTGKPLKPFATIEAAGLRTEAQLRRWVELAATYAAAQEPAKAKRRKRAAVGKPARAAARK